MRIDLEKLEETGGRFSHTYQPGDLPFEDVDFVLSGPAEVEGRARRLSAGVELGGELDTRLSVSCSRCLKKLELPVKVRFSERFVPAVDWRNEEQHELREEDLDLAVFDGEAIDLDDVVREEIMLAVPGHVLCEENCQGLCPVCGMDRNVSACKCESEAVDPRWEKLKELRS